MLTHCSISPLSPLYLLCTITFYFSASDTKTLKYVWSWNSACTLIQMTNGVIYLFLDELNRKRTMVYDWIMVDGWPSSESWLSLPSQWKSSVPKLHMVDGSSASTCDSFPNILAWLEYGWWWTPDCVAAKRDCSLSVLQVRLTTHVHALCNQCIYLIFKANEKLMSKWFSSKWSMYKLTYTFEGIKVPWRVCLQ